MWIAVCCLDLPSASIRNLVSLPCIWLHMCMKRKSMFLHIFMVVSLLRKERMESFLQKDK